ncbi:MAG: Nramp family divalent metal transporter [Bacteroidales bacterium]|nr:Nramp family divalent metal transporter [Bacteroidales bacterium]
MKNLKSRLLNVLFWSVVSAAFIGPGTVTTATKAGANFGFDLLWALVFSTFACLLLQEASARITINSGMNLGQAIAKQFEGKSSKTLILLLVIGAIILGSAAYETGNILGSIAGLSLVFDIPQKILVALIGILAFAALNFRSMQGIARFMGGIVFFMGLAFFTTAIQLKPPIGEILKGSFIPTIPETEGAGLLILGLIGTTVVPYDLFLGSGVLNKKQAISELRFGLSVAVVLGGIISMAIMTVGTVIETEFTYETLAQALTYRVGSYAVYIFGFGMFAAGFSSAITAPLASALTAQSLFEEKSKKRWKTQGIYFRLVYTGVLLVGLFFGLMEIKPIPAIILAQAFNGLILPFISIFLIYVINDPELMGKSNTNGWLSNILMAIVMWVTMVMGIISIVRAIAKAINVAINQPDFLVLIVGVISFFISIAVLYYISKYRRKKEVSMHMNNILKNK